jgi:hypothetical protein
MQLPRWTKPYYGISHIDNTRAKHQYTFIDYGPECMVDAYVFINKTGEKTIERQFRSIEEAKYWLEFQYRELEK